MPALAASPTPAAAASAAAERRERALSVHLDRLREDATLGLDPWVVEQVQVAFAASAHAGSVPGLVAQGAALQLKCRSDCERLGSAALDDSSRLYAAEAELMLDLGVGIALSRELQGAIDEAVRRGGAREARDLTRFHHELRRTLADLKRQIAKSEHARAEALSEALTAQPKAEPPPRVDPQLQRLAEDIAVRHEWVRARRLRERALRVAAHLPSRTELLVLALAFMAASWLAIVAVPRLASHPPRLLTRGDLPAGGALVAVDARPPALYVEVDGDAWESLDDAERRKLVGGVSSVALAEGYVGAVFRTREARPVAQWLAGRGPELIADAERPDADPRHAVTRIVERASD